MPPSCASFLPLQAQSLPFLYPCFCYPKCSLIWGLFCHHQRSSRDAILETEPNIWVTIWTNTMEVFSGAVQESPYTVPSKLLLPSRLLLNRIHTPSIDIMQLREAVGPRFILG